MSNDSRLIEHAFPLKQASLDSVHEKNVRHGHISTLHIWPARRPLAACRAALIATLLPDPGTPEKRKELCEKIGGKVVKKIERKKMPNGQILEREKEVTEGGILHWGRETENKELLDWFRQEIRKAYGGRAPKVLDPFAGGGAIPLEAMRLGCEATAIDLNPVAWFILKCTLEYPQKLAGKIWPLPDFILENEEFMEAFYKAHPHLVGRTKKTQKQKDTPTLNFSKTSSERTPKADLAWHVRAWGQWVLNKARRELARYYPVYADFEPLDPRLLVPYEKQPLRAVPLKDDGIPNIDELNKDFSTNYLANKGNPRWVEKPTVAYLWARTVKCKNCRATIPLLKTRWLSKKDKKRVLLTMQPNADKIGVFFGIDKNVPVKGGNTAQRRENDKRIGGGTMSRSGAKCPCCGTIMKMEDIRLEGQAGRLNTVNTAVVVNGRGGKEYRLPTDREIKASENAGIYLHDVFNLIPLGLINERLSPASTRSISCHLYGMDSFQKVFTPRQLLALGTFAHSIKNHSSMRSSREDSFISYVNHYLCVVFGKLADYCSQFCIWEPRAAEVKHTFARYSFSMPWDFSECNPIVELDRYFVGGLKVVASAIEYLELSTISMGAPKVIQGSADELTSDSMYDLIATDPPYYEAISYSDISDFFYIWLRRLMHPAPEFHDDLAPKDKEIVQHVREDKDTAEERKRYEDGMYRSFERAHRALTDEGRLVAVFAHKNPSAWGTLVEAMVRSGFVVTASWPIMTEMPSRQRGYGLSALASSVWLVCKKRQAQARTGWDKQVLEEMRRNIREKLREFWDAGIRGPDFVWAATGPALEVYSKHPIVKKANDPGQTMTVSEFLTHVRRIVVDFVVGRVLSGDGVAEAEEASAERLDEPTAYYLLHRHDFGLDEAPAGACILYAISCGLSDRELAATWDLITFTKGKSVEEDNGEEAADADAEADAEVEEDFGSKVKLKTWVQRKSRSLGLEAPGGKPIPLIDRLHCIMHLWKGGDVHKVDEYLDENGLRRQELFKRLLQSLIELSPQGSEERSLLESISNHVQARGATKEKDAQLFPVQSKEE
jgi:adenine-specific DNA methylase